VTTTLSYRPIPAEVLKELRQVDDAGAPMRPFDDAEGGAPLRCCLRRSEPAGPGQVGERIALVTYAPVRRWAARAGVDPGAYDEQGPIFIHADECPGRLEDADAYPVGLHGTLRVFRAYDQQGHIAGGQLVEVEAGAAASVVPGVLDNLFADPDVAFVHARAVEYGCFLFEVNRSGR
jgi:hypothetical protein